MRTSDGILVTRLFVLVVRLAPLIHWSNIGSYAAGVVVLTLNFEPDFDLPLWKIKFAAAPYRPIREHYSRQENGKLAPHPKDRDLASAKSTLQELVDLLQNKKASSSTIENNRLPQDYDSRLYFCRDDICVSVSLVKDMTLTWHLSQINDNDHKIFINLTQNPEQG